MNSEQPLVFDRPALAIDPARGRARSYRKFWRYWLWSATGAVAILLAADAAFGVYGHLFSAAPAIKYRLAPIDAGPIVTAIATAGTLKPLAAILVGSQASGQIKELLADFNSPVRAGDVIARLDNDTVHGRLVQAVVEVEVAVAAVEVQRAQLQRARADVAGAQAALLVAQADVERAEAVLGDAQRERDRKQELFGRGVGSVVERDRSDAAYDTARAQLVAAKARVTGAISAQAAAEAAVQISSAQLENSLALVKQREAAVQQVRIDLDHTVILAPIDGVVIDRPVDVGQTIAASLQTPTLFTIAPDLGAMTLHANVDEAEIGRVVVGQDASFTVDSYPGRSFPGRVMDVRKMPQTMQSVVTYTVVISADNEDLLLLPGMTANVRILVQRRDDVLKLPNAALRFRPAGVPASPPMTIMADPTPSYLLRAALDRIGLSNERRAELEQVIEDAECASADRNEPPSTAKVHAQACRQAATRVSALLAPRERTQYQTARSQLAREQSITSVEVWVIGPDGVPEARRLQLGISDGLATEIVAGELSKGDRVIVGAEAQPTRSAGLVGL